MADDLLQLLSPRSGHFLYESGHHGDLSLEVDASLLRTPNRLEPFVRKLVEKLRTSEPEMICGPMIGGAFVAQRIALALDAEFCYAERTVNAETKVYYRIPAVMRSIVRGQRVAVVDDVINAGSAVGGTIEDLLHCGAIPVAIGALLILGTAAAALAARHGAALESVATHPINLWKPEDCPLCAAGVPLDRTEGI